VPPVPLRLRERKDHYFSRARAFNALSAPPSVVVRVFDSKEDKVADFFRALLVLIDECSIPRPLDQANSFPAPSTSEREELASPSPVEGFRQIYQDKQVTVQWSLDHG
jgi:hypothetical protein